MSDYVHYPMFPLAAEDTPWRKLTGDHVSTATFEGETVLKVDPQALTLLTAEAFKDISHLLRPRHLDQLAKILDDPEASDNDRFVALDLLKQPIHQQNEPQLILQNPKILDSLTIHHRQKVHPMPMIQRWDI